jgi:hypothetical protein
MYSIITVNLLTSNLTNIEKHRPDGWTVINVDSLFEAGSIWRTSQLNKLLNKPKAIILESDHNDKLHMKIEKDIRDIKKSDRDIQIVVCMPNYEHVTIPAGTDHIFFYPVNGEKFWEAILKRINNG